METELTKAIEAAQIPGAQKHLFLCIGPECCSEAEGQKVWDFLKKQVKECDLKVMRTKAACFRICTGGPWLLVYPEGVWYGNVTIERCERILREHIADGKPIEEWIATQNSL